MIRAAADEAAEIHLRKQYSPVDGGPPEVHRLYRTSILVRGADGEFIITDNPAELEAGGLPQPLASIEFEIGTNYRIATGNQAHNRLLVRLDFTKPPALDFGNPSGAPTPNESSIEVSGADQLWVAGIFERVRSVLYQGRVRSGWLHLAHTYDGLVLAIGLPLSFSLAVLAGSRIRVPASVDAGLFRVAVVFIIAILVLTAFRLCFSMVRWLLPYVELTTSPEPVHRRARLFLAAIIFAVATGVLGNAIFAMLGRN